MSIQIRNYCSAKPVVKFEVMRKQRGATLIVGLVMLVVLTLLVLSAIRSSTINMRIAGNMQMQEEAKAAAYTAIETVISSSTFTTTPPATTRVSIGKLADYPVTFAKPTCVSAYPTVKTDPGLPEECTGSAGLMPVCYWTTWDISASVIDPFSGASTEAHQGVRVLAGIDAAAANCGV